nr:MAG TPA: hypothetical protein [Bacteriophage sp.]
MCPFVLPCGLPLFVSARKVGRWETLGPSSWAASAGVVTGFPHYRGCCPVTLLVFFSFFVVETGVTVH